MKMKRIELISFALLVSLFLFFYGCGEQEENSAQLAIYQNSTTIFNNNTTSFGNNTTVFGNNADINSPSVPLNFSVSALSYIEINIFWDASSDNVGVAGYKIYRDGNYLNFITSTSANDTGLTGETQYCYSVSAVDSSDNESSQTAQICATTSQTPWQMLSGYYMANIAADSNGNIYIAGVVPDYDGSYEYDMFLAKFDTNGIRQWIVKRGSVKTGQPGASGGNDGVKGIAVYNNIIYVEWFYDADGGGEGGMKGYVSAYDSNGNNLWDYEIASAGDLIYPDVYLKDIAINDFGIYVSYAVDAGLRIKKLDFNGNLLKKDSPVSVPEHLSVFEGNLYSSGHMSDIYIAKCDSDINKLWQTTWNYGYNGFNYGIVADATGVYTAGGFYANSITSSTSFYLLKYDPNGQLLWEVKDENMPASYVIAIDDTGVYTGGNAGYLMKFQKDNCNNCSPLWKVSTTYIDDTVVFNNVVYVVDDNYFTIFRYNTSTGEQIQ